MFQSFLKFSVIVYEFHDQCIDLFWGGYLSHWDKAPSSMMLWVLCRTRNHQSFCLQRMHSSLLSCLPSPLLNTLCLHIFRVVIKIIHILVTSISWATCDLVNFYLPYLIFRCLISVYFMVEKTSPHFLS